MRQNKKTFEKVLYTHLLQTIYVLNGLSPFRESEIKSKALLIRVTLVRELKKYLKESSDVQSDNIRSEKHRLR